MPFWILCTPAPLLQRSFLHCWLPCLPFPVPAVQIRQRQLSQQRCAHERFSVRWGQNRTDHIGEKSKENATDYADFLEDMGYKVFFKNINLNYSVGKVRLRPWAEMGGCIATNATTFNRELLIVEKSNDGKPFELHTSYADKEKYYRNLRNPWLFLLLLFALFAIIKHSIVLGIFSLVSAIPSILYQLQIINVRQKAKTWEQ